MTSISLNKVMLLGFLGRDPEVRTFNDGNRIVTFSLATSESWKDRGTGERKEKVEWHGVVIHNEKIGEVAERYLRKGARIYIEGKLQTRRWTSQDGVERITTEVIVPRFGGEMKIVSYATDRQTTFSDSGKTADADDVPFDDEIPF